MVYAVVDRIDRNQQTKLLRIEEREITAGNSDIKLTRHASDMMHRRAVNSNSLAEVIYSTEGKKEDERIKGLETIVYAARLGSREIEAICKLERCGASEKYVIKVITVHVEKGDSRQ